MMTPAEIRMKQSPILTSLLLGLGQGRFIAEKLFPRLPSALSSVTLAKVGDERLRKYNLKRAPGASTKRIDIKFEGQVYTVDQASVEVPIPRELIREADESRRLNVANYLDISQIAMVTANDILLLDYELDVAALATNPDTYAAGHVITLAGNTQWSHVDGTPVDDIDAAAQLIRRKTGRRPNKLTLSEDAYQAVKGNLQVRSYLPDSQLGHPTIDQLKGIFEVEEIEIGDAVWVNEADARADVWGNNAILAYVPRMAGGASISLVEPAFGFTNVIEGHPFAEAPYYSNEFKTWVYGATYERRPNVAYNTAAVLFQNPK